MNPFETDYKNTNVKQNENITIHYETHGKKKTTYIIGWDITETELKEHAKIFKKKHGCNGTVKKFTFDEKEYLGILFQGDHIDNILNYLSSLGITQVSIKGA